MIRRYYATRTTPWGLLGSFITLIALPPALVRVYVELIDRALQVLDDPPFGLKRGDATLSSLWESMSDSDWMLFTGTVSLALAILFLAIIWQVATTVLVTTLLKMAWKYLMEGSWNASRFPKEIAKVIEVAVGAYSRPSGSAAQQAHLNRLDYVLRTVYEALVRMSSEIVTVSTPSRRRDCLREHHLKVIAVLREKESALDVDARTALPDLAETLTRIANAYSAGRMGQLLPASETDHVTPFEPPKRGPFKMVAVAVLLGGCGVLVAFLDLPDTATTSLIGAMGITIASMVYGHKARNSLDILDSVRGIQRP
ncbi:hypothetical protein ACFVGX_23510 [Streptomyces sp. NPDC127113]|uniref:hypothetical protein n=1 Tax=Streptomyces sp. NPDC127113 TaxID=3345365 RepID=UPI00363E8557